MSKSGLTPKSRASRYAGGPPPSIRPLDEFDGQDQDNGQGDLGQALDDEAVGVGAQLAEVGKPRVGALDRPAQSERDQIDPCQPSLPRRTGLLPVPSSVSRRDRQGRRDLCRERPAREHEREVGGVAVGPPPPPGAAKNTETGLPTPAHASTVPRTTSPGLPPPWWACGRSRTRGRAPAVRCPLRPPPVPRRWRANPPETPARRRPSRERDRPGTREGAAQVRSPARGRPTRSQD